MAFLRTSMDNLFTQVNLTNKLEKITIKPRKNINYKSFIDDENKFYLNKPSVEKLYKLKPIFGFNGLGEVVYYRTYSRSISTGKGKGKRKQEHWINTVVRVINGLYSIRKNHNIKNRLAWDEEKWQKHAEEAALSMFQLQWCPPGRGLWAMGTEFVEKRGSSALFNCAFTSTKNDLLNACHWTMDFLMHGTGVGFDTFWNGTAIAPNKKDTYEFIIPDSREGWCDSVYALMNAYIPDKNNKLNRFPIFDYSKIRKKGLPIRGFGGVASGPAPLVKLHQRIIKFLDDFINNKITPVRLVTDIMNSIGACVVAGNVRRSAEIALGSASNEEFKDLKNYNKYPERAEIGWMSNNSIVLRTKEDFHRLPELVKRIINNGEPGLINLINIQKYGRIGKELKDNAEGINPCGEIPLEDKELCNLSELFPTRCIKNSLYYHKKENNCNKIPFNKENFDLKAFEKAARFATFYSSTVALLPTHRPESNRIIAKNRRIGVSITGIADWLDEMGQTKITTIMRNTHKIVRKSNKLLAEDAGVPQSVRLTTVKPSGTISQLAGVNSGMHFPTFKYAIRRVRFADNSPLSDTLIKNGVPHEKDKYSDNTLVFEFPIFLGKTRKATEVSIWEQLSISAMLQREWADNSVSFTGYFDPKKEAHQLEQAVATYAPLVKAISLLPHTEQGAYEQMPYEGITKEEYEKRLNSFPKLDWNEFAGSDGIMAKYCTNDSCEIIKIK